MLRGREWNLFDFRVHVTETRRGTLTLRFFGGGNTPVVRIRGLLCVSLWEGQTGGDALKRPVQMESWRDIEEAAESLLRTPTVHHAFPLCMASTGSGYLCCWSAGSIGTTNVCMQPQSVCPTLLLWLLKGISSLSGPPHPPICTPAFFRIC